ncbi:MAG: tRNA (adenosine(37)-N6)-threonylcarbamoyltransferase complex transferase subunit TsaD [Candidatus Magasanikbacteria bacterium]|nr:tRNA (adenosine(37)-N6)-threonylcarbamoyltransferase complex transferase subunit TsaD [Candidatus Magasanikbacteria bacterium]
MLILGIESSCDDTSVALLDCSDKGCFVLSEKTASQIDIHKKYGGVVPEIAGRMHAEKIVPLIEAVLENQPKPDAIAVTSGPGLITGLLVGVEAARTLSYITDLPIVSTNHIEGHIYSTQIKNFDNVILNNVKDPSRSYKRDSSAKPQNDKKEIQFPALCLVVSGGHTELILMKNHGKYKLLGATIDDAAGECFDKGAKLIGLPYPGGPQISKLAVSGNTRAIHFPRPMIDSKDYNFSFSGLKTSALYWLRDNKNSLNINDFCASFEQAIIDVLVSKTMKAAKEYKPKTIILGGGVSANPKLRQTLQEEINKNLPDTDFQIPQMKYAMDNGAMIAVAGYHHAKQKDYTSWKKIKADPNWRLAK